MNQLNGYDVEDLRVGMSASFSKTITEADLVLFAGVSGDNNAMHVNEEFAAATPRGGAGCPNTELASISGALRVWLGCRVVHGGGRTALATYRPADAVDNSCSPLKLPD